jgi:hypothetical protein
METKIAQARHDTAREEKARMSEKRKHADWWCVFDPKTGIVLAVFATESERDEWMRGQR